MCAGFGARLRQLREEQGISAAELASAIGINHKTVHGYERGKWFPSVINMFAISIALGCTLADLLPDQASLR